MTPRRIEVEQFADLMEQQLKENDHKGAQGWKLCTTAYLSEKLLEEVAELLLSLDSQDFSDIELESIFKVKIQRLRKGDNILSSPSLEAADVGNVSMMLSDPERRKGFKDR